LLIARQRRLDFKAIELHFQCNYHQILWLESEYTRKLRFLGAGSTHLYWVRLCGMPSFHAPCLQTVRPPRGPWVVNGSAYAPTATTAYHLTATPATPTQTGSIADCGRYYSVVSGDTCNQICLVYGITFDQLQDFNPYLNNDCTNLWLGYSVCIAKVSPDPVSTGGLCGPNNDFATCNGTSNLQNKRG
jgi:hypothetical protein